MKNYFRNYPLTIDVLIYELEATKNLSNIGGQVFFLGTVRQDKIEDKKVNSIIYTAYEEMANIEFDKIEKFITNKYLDIKKIAIIHSLGEVKISENSLFIFLAGEHRKDILNALPEIIDLLKSNVPIWKKEIAD